MKEQSFKRVYLLIAKAIGLVAQLVRAPPCHGGGRGFESHPGRHFASVAQLVEQRTENPCVPGSIPGGTTFQKQSECSAVGSALRSGRRGRAFESPHSDIVKDKPLNFSGLSHF